MAGGSEEFDAFYASTARGLCAQVYALTGDWAEAQDCVQEAYARAWQRWSSVRILDQPAAWVRLVAFRLARPGPARPGASTPVSGPRGASSGR